MSIILGKGDYYQKKNYQKKKNYISIKKNKQAKNYFFNKRIQIITNIKIIKIIIIIMNLIRILSNDKRILNLFKLANITLKVKGIGNKNIFSNVSGKSFNIDSYPNEIYINGINQDQITYNYFFNQTVNVVELIWNHTISDCFAMFRECNDIIEYDFTNFDTSGVIYMHDMFWGCTNITSLNLSNFNTCDVKEFNYMFYNCQSLTSLNLSNFNTSHLTRIDRMFYGCIHLEYLNIQNFDEHTISSLRINIFTEVPDNIVICINPEINQNIIFAQIQTINCYSIDCSNEWKLSQKKIIDENNQCINSCFNSSDYPFEYNGK